MRTLRRNLLAALATLALASALAPEPAAAVTLADGATVQSVYYRRHYWRHRYYHPYYHRHYRRYGSDVVRAHRA